MTLTGQFSRKEQHDAGTVTAITRLRSGAHDIFLLRVRPPAGFVYRAGQYVDIGFGKLAPRSYSIANAPGEPDIEIHIKRAGGEASLFIASVLKVGDSVTVSPAQGDSTFDPAERRPVVAIAGGMGFTPMKAVVEAALRHDPDAEVHFFWGTNAPDEQYMRAYFEDMAGQYDNFRFHPVAGTPVGEAAAAHLRSLSGYRIFIAGPPPMISAVVPQLLARGADRAAISYDRLAPRTSPGGTEPA
jgi:ferredoxin-NADP reductase